MTNTLKNFADDNIEFQAYIAEALNAGKTYKQIATELEWLECEVIAVHNA